MQVRLPQAETHGGVLAICQLFNVTSKYLNRLKAFVTGQKFAEQQQQHCYVPDEKFHVNHFLLWNNNV